MVLSLFALNVLSTREVSRELSGAVSGSPSIRHYLPSVAEHAQATTRASFDRAGGHNTLLLDEVYLFSNYSSFVPASLCNLAFVPPCITGSPRHTLGA